MRHFFMRVLMGMTMIFREAGMRVRVVPIIMTMGVRVHERRMEMKMLVPLLEQ